MPRIYQKMSKLRWTFQSPRCKAILLLIHSSPYTLSLTTHAHRKRHPFLPFVPPLQSLLENLTHAITKYTHTHTPIFRYLRHTSLSLSHRSSYKIKTLNVHILFLLTTIAFSFFFFFFVIIKSILSGLKSKMHAEHILYFLYLPY